MSNNLPCLISLQSKWKYINFFYRSTFVGSAWSFFFFHPRHNGQWPPTSKDFYIRSYPLHYCLNLILEKEPVFPFPMLIAKQGTTGTIFKRSLVWRCPCLGIEPGTSRTRSQHSTTRLSRRRSQLTKKYNHADNYTSIQYKSIQIDIILKCEK